ncbi:hypothetical protein DFQ28_008348 [Apophysomyces sp. BC1034]|nr:hypothetical protein DFQ30_008073 [Apophysomyces sp. BC1015]KAG0182757.1 hypothetical protein DFQ29_002392 [Apophysomyces sp. BC1021]KAG0186080.1 hypothetical protein DFQ28_008348 [Apophysomyces sp. BC1034]
MAESTFSPRSQHGSLRRLRRNKESNGPSSRPPSPPGTPASPQISPISNVNETDPVIPTAIVIKNIPFSVKKDALLGILNNLDIPAPYAFNYHLDNGVFRGLAFANYRTPQETDVVVKVLNGLDIGGRKLRVEYKRVLPAALEKEKEERKRGKDEVSSLERKSSGHSLRQNPSEEDTLDLNDPAVLQLYDHFLLFRSDVNRQEIALPKSLFPKERRDAHMIAERLGLAHYSEGFGPDRQLYIAKKPAQKSSRGSLRQSSSRDRLSLQTDGKSKRDTVGYYRKSIMNNSAIAGDTLSVNNVVHPIRQPRGPDPGKNFASRRALQPDQLADTLDRQHLTHVGA